MSVTDVGLSLLIAASALLLHWVCITGVVEAVAPLRDVWLTRQWRRANLGPYSRMANAVVGGVMGAAVTGLMVLFLFADGHMRLIWASELALAGGYLIYLLRLVPRGVA